MGVLVVAEHDSETLKRGTLSAIGFARTAVAAEGDADAVKILILGEDIGEVSEDASHYGHVLSADAPALARPDADRYAKLVAQVAQENSADVVAAATTFAKDIVGRAAAYLGGAMASDVVGHELQDGELLLRRPMYAGSLTATVKLLGQPRIITVRPSAYSAVERRDDPFTITTVPFDESALPSRIVVEALETKSSGRPDVTEARVVVSGGRAFKNSDDFERLVGGLADALQGSAGSTRALVDSGITPNELQVGQTGKIVAPELYVALGLSGALQHLAGMKNSKVVVAVNTDPEAPIFEVADYGLVADVYEVVPELIEKLSAVTGRS
jgi:electron transfer flavoprotein alpha subunit